MGTSTVRADLGNCPDCGANLNLVGFSHNCQPSEAKEAEPAPPSEKAKGKIGRPPKYLSHPDCDRCRANRKASRERMRKRRESRKQAEGSNDA